MEDREDSNPRSPKRIKQTENGHKEGAKEDKEEQDNDFLSSLQTDIRKTAKVKASQIASVPRKPDPNYEGILTDLMLRMPLFDSEVQPKEEEEDDEESHNAARPKGTPDGNAKKIELEMRVGYHDHMGHFTPQVKKQDFDAFHAALQKDQEMGYEKTQQIQYFYEIHEGNLRVVWDDAKKACVSAELKQRLQTTEVMELSFLQYACRFSISSEEPHPIPPVLPEGWKLCRKKTRWSYSKNRTPSPPSLNPPAIQLVQDFDQRWKIDLTEVRTIHASDKSREDVTYELEFEFDEEMIRICKTADVGVVRTIVQQFWNFVAQFMNHLHKSGENHFAKFLKLEKVDNEETLSGLRESFCSWIPGLSEYNTEDFPGSMPINFSGSSIPVIQRSQYYVSEKTDGVRCMIAIMPLQGVYLVDRKFDFYAVSDYDILMDLFATEGPTILDGEMVLYIPNRQPMYLIFDILALNGKPQGQLTLDQRLLVIGKEVIPAYREKIEAMNIPHPFPLMGKNFFKMTDFHKVYGSVITEKNERRYRDQKRYHKTDGFIFTPIQEAYHPKTTNTLFKWKYLDELSIDMKVTLNRSANALHFTCVGDRGVDIEYPMQVKPEHCARLLRYMTFLKSTNSLIVELTYDFNVKMWRFKCIRSDKAKANHVRVVRSTIQVLTEGLDVKELLRRFPPRDRAANQ